MNPNDPKFEHQDVELDDEVYRLLLRHKQLECTNCHKALVKDLEFLHEDLWLQDSAVVEWVVRLNGAWQVYLIFVHYENPFLLIKRFIKTQFSLKKAKLEAHYMKRLAGKDQRGTLQIKAENFAICKN